ncbi:MAG: hypothetical protein ACT4PI_08500 [Actinomycetota bacterium]
MVTLRTPPSESATRAGPGRQLNRFVARFPRAPAMLVLTIAVLALPALTSGVESHVSAVDEREHIDHLIRGSRGELIQGGNQLTQETLRELCTRGSEYIEWPKCEPGRLDPADYSVGGINAAGDRPFYYIVNGPAARALNALTPGSQSLVTWGRLLGSAWLLLGMYLVVRVGDRLGLSRWAVVPALVLVAALPIQLTASATVTPDAMAFAIGAALLLAGLWWEATSRGLWLLAVFGVVSVLFDATLAVGGLVVLTYFAVRAVVSAREGPAADRQSPRRYALAAGVLALSLAVGIVGWERVEDERTPAPVHPYTEEELDTRPQLDPLRTESDAQSLTVKRVLGGQALFAMFPPVVEVAPPFRRSIETNAPWYQAWVLAATFLMVGALLLAALRPALDERSSALGLATTIALIAGSALMLMARYRLYDGYDPIVPRFGLSALPAVALVLATAARERAGRGLLVAVAAGLAGTALLTLT